MGSQYYNYKGTNSIILLIVAGSDYEVVWADVGTNGRVSDGGVLSRSKFGELLYENKLNLPGLKPLPYREKPMPYVFIGDDAFALLPNFMKPYSTKKLDLSTRICNYRFSRARRISENVFGILTAQWRIFSSPIALPPEKVRNITTAVLILHNWLRSGKSKNAYIPSGLCDSYDFNLQTIVPGGWRKSEDNNCFLRLQPLQYGHKSSLEAKEVRNKFKEYFLNEGALSWQWQYCLQDVSQFF